VLDAAFPPLGLPRLVSDNTPAVLIVETLNDENWVGTRLMVRETVAVETLARLSFRA
jgi:hypothetical protein